MDRTGHQTKSFNHRIPPSKQIHLFIHPPEISQFWCVSVPQTQQAAKQIITNAFVKACVLNAQHMHEKSAQCLHPWGSVLYWWNRNVSELTLQGWGREGLVGCYPPLDEFSMQHNEIFFSEIWIWQIKHLAGCCQNSLGVYYLQAILNGFWNIVSCAVCVPFL